MAGDYLRRVNLANEEMKKQEERLMSLLRAEPMVSPEVRAAMERYASVANSPIDMPSSGLQAPFHGPKTFKARSDAYDGVLEAYRKTMSAKVDPTDPLERKFMDNVAGAINRREVAEKQCDAEVTAYEQFANTWQGKIANVFSLQSTWVLKKKP
jgi:hypothetical protein